MSKKRILVAEDESITGLHLSRVLTEAGFTVMDVVSTAEEVIRRAAQDRPDLVLMDVLLKGSLSGTEAAREIHARYGIPTLYITAFTPKELVQRGGSAGTFEYIPKPIDIEMLLQKVRSLLDRKPGSGQHEPTAKCR